MRRICLQEQNIKTGRFAMIYADEVIISHTNENEFNAFVANKKNEALKDRTILVKVPYNLRVSDEVRIYEKLLGDSGLTGVHVAPHTLRVSSTFAILTRLEASKKAGMSLMKKLKLYDGESVDTVRTQGREGRRTPTPTVGALSWLLYRGRDKGWNGTSLPCY